MSSGPSPAPETLLSTPLPCWHESLHAARTDLIVGLSPRRARIATGRPLPVGTPVFLELGHDAGIDAIAIDSDADAFVVEFITVDAAAAALIARTLAGPRPALPRTRTDELCVPAAAAVELPPFAVETRVSLPATERTGDFLAADIDAAIGDRDLDFGPSTTPATDLALAALAPLLEVADVPAPPVDGGPPDLFELGDDTATTPVAPGPAAAALFPSVPDVEPIATETPAWVRAFSADLGEEPELPATGHTQRWPTAHAASSENGIHATAAPISPTTPAGWLGEVTPEPQEQPWPTTVPALTPTSPTGRVTTTSAVVTAPAPTPTPPPAWPAGIGDPDDHATTARWPAARVVRVATPTPTPAAAPTPATPTPTPSPRLGGVSPGPAAPVAFDETARWPVARVAVASPPTAPAAVAAPPALSFEDAEDIVLELTAPPRPAVSRPLPPPGDGGVVEVDFSEFRDVLGVATFKTGDARPITPSGRVSTPQPVSIALPRTPSNSHRPWAPARTPSGGDSVGPTDSPPPVADGDTDASLDDQWVVFSPGLPGGLNSVTPQPLLLYDATPGATPVPSPGGPSRPPAVGPVPASPRPFASAGAAWVTPGSLPEQPAISADEHEAVTAPGGGVRVLPLTSSAEDLPLVVGDGEDVDLLD